MTTPITPVTKSPRVVVIGPCASGKSTLVAGLRRLGYDADVCGQEHSDIPTLWRHTEPDVVIALEIDLATLRQRRGCEWPEWLYHAQQRRLQQAVASASVRINTARLDASGVLREATARLPPLTAGSSAGASARSAGEPGSATARLVEQDVPTRPHDR